MILYAPLEDDDPPSMTVADSLREIRRAARLVFLLAFEPLAVRLLELIDEAIEDPFDDQS